VNAAQTDTETDRVQFWAELMIEPLSGAQLDKLAHLTGPVIGAGVSAFDDWARGVRRSAARTGFILAGDLRVALDLMGRDLRMGPPRLRGAADLARLLATEAAVELRDLYRYALSATYQDLLDARSGEGEEG
jgi:hypothetical protein